MAKRETIGKRLKRARDATGMTVPQLVEKIRWNHHKTIGGTTILDTEKDATPNPSIKTVEAIARGLGLDPLEVISLGLEDPPELEPGFKASQFASLWKSYSRLSRERRAFVDDYIETLIEKIDRWQQAPAKAAAKTP